MTDSTTRPNFLREIPPREKDEIEARIAEAADAAASHARHSEAKRDAVVAVLLAIQRRGDNVITGWTTKDLETAIAIGELLAELKQ
jgi:hypothetical protein